MPRISVLHIYLSYHKECQSPKIHYRITRVREHILCRKKISVLLFYLLFLLFGILGFRVLSTALIASGGETISDKNTTFKLLTRQKQEVYLSHLQQRSIAWTINLEHRYTRVYPLKSFLELKLIARSQ